MKKPDNVADLTARLTAGSTAALVARKEREEPPEEAPPKIAKKAAASKPVFLRVPEGLYARYEAEAMDRTRATGKGVTVQQVMLEKLEASL